MPQWETVFNLHARCALDVLSDLKPYQDNSQFRNGGVHYLSCFENEVLTEKVQLDQSDDITLITHALSYTADQSQAENGVGFCLYLILSCDTQDEASALHQQFVSNLHAQLNRFSTNAAAPLYREVFGTIECHNIEQAPCLGQFGHTYNQYLKENTKQTDLLLRLTWFAPDHCRHITEHSNTVIEQATYQVFAQIKAALQPIKARLINKLTTSTLQ